MFIRFLCGTNSEVPWHRNRENYIHRIGRSGRFGRKGVAINVSWLYYYLDRMLNFLLVRDGR